MDKTRQVVHYDKKLTADDLADHIIYDFLHPEKMQRLRPQSPSIEDYLARLFSGAYGAYGAYDEYDEYDDDDYYDEDDYDDYDDYDYDDRECVYAGVRSSQPPIRPNQSPAHSSRASNRPDHYPDTYRNLKLPSIDDILSIEHYEENILFPRPMFVSRCIGVLDFSISQDFQNHLETIQLAIAMFLNRDIPCFGITNITSSKGACLKVHLDQSLMGLFFYIVLADQTEICLGADPRFPTIRFKVAHGIITIGRP